ncbi:MAG: hypothetical protein WBQ94_12745 [Terracidiphilus sp.]
MIRRVLQAVLCLVVCPVLIAQQLPATAVDLSAPQRLPNNPEPAPAGKADWERVQDLANGEEIMVERGRGLPVPCLFAGATGDYLFCDSMYSGHQYRFVRSQVQRVRRDDKRRNVHILIGGLAAAGFIWGVATPPADGYPRLLGGLAGAGIGAFAGVVVGLPVALLVPGRTVFHQSISKNKAADPVKNPETPEQGFAP